MMRNDLSDLRGQLDEIDEKLLALYELRMDVCAQVAKYKFERGIRVLDAAREEEKLKKLCDLVQNKEYAAGVSAFFEQIISGSRSLQLERIQILEHKINSAFGGFRAVKSPFDILKVTKADAKKPRVVYQGAPGSYSKIAAQQYFKHFGETAQYVSAKAFEDLFDMVGNGAADFAVLPIENSTAGVVAQAYTLMAENNLYIVDTLLLPVRHCLLGFGSAGVKDVKRVYSHPQSFMQCSRFLDENSHIKCILAQNNAFAAQTVAKAMDESTAAIAPFEAAAVYGLCILKSDIQNSDDNATQFAILSKEPVYKSGAKKISVCFELPDESGSLYRCLSHFIYNRLNMTKIESRPLEKRGFAYRFFVDVEGNLGETAVANALEGLKTDTNHFKILGNY